MLVVSLHDDQTGASTKIEIPGKKTALYILEKELQSGNYPSHVAFTHRGSNLEAYFHTTQEFRNYSIWIINQIS